MSEFFRGKIVNEGIKAAVQAAETQSQFVVNVQRLSIEEFQHSVTQQENAVGSKAKGEDHKNNKRQPLGSVFLDCLGILGQLPYDTDVTESRDKKGEEKERELPSKDVGCPGRPVRKHIFLQHIKTRNSPEFMYVKG